MTDYLTALAKRWQLHQILARHQLEWVAGVAPGPQSAGDHKCIESLFSE